MRLFTRYNRINLFATIIVFILSGTAFYFAIRYILINQVDDDLRIEQREIETYLHEHGTLPEPVPVKDQKISYTLVAVEPVRRVFKTIPALDTSDRDPYRLLEFGIRAKDKNYLVSVEKSLEGTDDLLQSIILISSSTILLILASSVIINRIVLRRLWRPFYASLDVIKKFRVDRKQALSFPASNIEEFSVMNQTLGQATQQAREEYLLLKEFTENASHEMQTPLAIIRSKLDLLIQDENLSEEQSKTVQSSYAAIEKLARLNQSLLLLARIENNQFAETAPVDLKKKIEEKLDAFHELWQNQHITIGARLEQVTVNLNSELAEILLNNLLSNATRHNFPDGRIEITLSPEKFEVANSSAGSALDTKTLFLRFFGQQRKTSFNGLGLSIIKRICDVSGFVVSYRHEADMHRFSIAWR
jgi:two-component system, OmpR family, sensor histidine kinase QseC